MNTVHQEPETQRRILCSAEKVFYRQGYDGARMQEIADEAGINKALLHYYFRSKERLFDAVFSDAVLRLVPPVFAVMNINAPLMDKVRAFVDAYFSTVVNNPFLPGFVVHEMHRNPSRFSEIIQGSRLFMLQGLQRQLDEGAESGKLVPMEAEQFMLNLLSLCAFPFVAAGAMQAVSGKNDTEYQQLLEERRQLIPEWMTRLVERHE
ncbi:MAG: TetR/AcrR family transcriptional regulator [Candidatus Chlorobium antarcticum]|jgi:AcrR family transcriptional regulator|nr:TetR/AcrR family transcriptional regulator [Candidatus Chlorobium antarcticum]